MNEVKTLTEFQTDALKEVGNIGIGQATTSLSKMVNKTVQISLPDLKFVPFIDVPQLIKQEEPMVGIILELKGDASGFLLLLLEKESAKFLVKQVLGDAQDTDSFDEMELSVLKELGNIMSGTYITALSNFLGVRIGLSVPSEVYDMADAIINQVICMMSMDADYILFQETEFAISSEKVSGTILMFADSPSISRILDAINKIAAQ